MSAGSVYSSVLVVRANCVRPSVSVCECVYEHVCLGVREYVFDLIM